MNKTKEITKTEPKELATSQDFSAENLIAQAIDKGVPVETMEKLLSMRRELRAEWAKEQFDLSMAAFQGECPIIQKKTEVKNNAGVVLYKYSKIEAIVEQVQPYVQKNGFSYRIVTGERNNMLFADCIVKHKTGHSETTPFEVPLGSGTSLMSAPQKQAASLTFAKRYAFCNAFGIMTGDEDTDANSETTEDKNEKGNPDTTPKNLSYADKLKATKSLDELKQVWASLPAAAKKELEPLKETIKQKYAGN